MSLSQRDRHMLVKVGSPSVKENRNSPRIHSLLSFNKHSSLEVDRACMVNDHRP
jgi:hypothetical protein